MLICTADCTCLRCGGVRLHVTKKVRQGDPARKIRSKKRAAAIEATRQLARIL